MLMSYQVFHPSELGKSVPASAGDEKSFERPRDGEFRAAVGSVPFLLTTSCFTEILPKFPLFYDCFHEDIKVKKWKDVKKKHARQSIHKYRPSHHGVYARVAVYRARLV